MNTSTNTQETNLKQNVFDAIKLNESELFLLKYASSSELYHAENPRSIDIAVLVMLKATKNKGN